MDGKNKPEICFVSMSSYPLLTGENKGYVGGAELQLVNLAKELANRGYTIYFVTSGGERNKSKKIDGVNILSAYSGKDDIGKGKKFLAFWSKLKEADSDLYIFKLAIPPLVPLFGVIHRKKTVKIMASNNEALKKDEIKGKWMNKFKNILNIKLSNIVVSQNDFQKEKLEENFGVDSVKISNSIKPIPTEDIEKGDDYVLWVGTLRYVKQPELFLDLAEEFPDTKFVMIGGKGESQELFEKIKIRSKKIDNLDFKGFVPYDQIYDYYKDAMFLVNTSKLEGFPNTFLEAWMFEKPVVSLNFDPDEIICRYELGFHSKSFDKLRKCVKILINKRKIREKLGKQARSYVKKIHDIENICDDYEKLFKKF